jgi:hypothetical protein
MSSFKKTMYKFELILQNKFASTLMLDATQSDVIENPPLSLIYYDGLMNSLKEDSIMNPRI